VTHLLEKDSRLAEEAALKATSAVPPSPPDPEADRTSYTENPEFETTYATNSTARSTSTNVTKTSSTGISKKKGKPKLTAKEKKERSVSTDPMTIFAILDTFPKLFIEKIVMSLPLEFRGSDPVRIPGDDATLLLKDRRIGTST
jgi:DASH complex subunit DAM1